MNDTEFIISLSDEAPIEPPPSKISEYINDRRQIPQGQPRAGNFKVSYAPFMIEPMDAMGPYSGINRVTMLKSVQTAATTYLAENVIAFYMDPCPSEIMYCSGTTDLLAKWTKRLEPLIDSCGFRHKIAAQVENTKSRKTGDKMYSKEYSGGSLSMVSLQSPAGMRSESNRILVIDEVDSAPANTTTGEGSFLGVLEGRTAAYGNTFKIIELSTPTTEEHSVIYKQFLAGDQRYYNMPCPRCGVMIVFKFEQLRPTYNKLDQLEAVYYECQECTGRIDEHEKTWMMETCRAEWIPTAVPKDKNHKSYHINALYSPVGMLGWQRIYQYYLQSEEDRDRKPSFVNLYLGLPYKEQGHRPPIEKVLALRGSYEEGEVPDGVLYLTFAADVQLGAEKYQKMTPEELDAEIEKIRASGGEMALWKAKLPRIEAEVMGVGLYHKTWSIDYKIFYGHTTLGSFSGAYDKLDQWSQEGGMKYLRRSDGRAFCPSIAIIDASEGKTQNSVFDIASRWRNTYPTINADWLKKLKDPGRDDEPSTMDHDRYRLSRKGNKVSEYVQISTNYYKKRVYSSLNIPRNPPPADTQPPGFYDFPRNRADHYFHMLAAEEQRADGSFHNGGRPAEALDCRVYNLCAADIWLESQVRITRENAKKKYPNSSEAEIKAIDKPFVLRKMALDLGVKL